MNEIYEIGTSHKAIRIRLWALLIGLVFIGLFIFAGHVYAAAVLGLNNNYGSDPSLDILSPNLSPMASINLGMTKGHRVISVEGIHIDKNNNKQAEPDEFFDLAFIGGRKACSAPPCGDIVIVDITHIETPTIIGRVLMPGIIRELDVDRDKKLLFAGGDRGASAGSSSAFYIIDISNPFSSFIDNNSDGKDDRIVWEQPYVASMSGTLDALRVDTVRNLIYVGINEFPYGRLDIWNMFGNSVGNVNLIQLDGLYEYEEENPGAYIHINDDDDNKNNIEDFREQGVVAGENDLKKFTLFPKSPSGQVSLDAVNGGKIRVWESAAKEKEVVLPAFYQTEELPVDLYVEGIEVSGSERDEELIATYTAGGLSFSDSAKLTVVKVIAREIGGMECSGLDNFAGPVPHLVVRNGLTSTFLLEAEPEITAGMNFINYDPSLVTVNVTPGVTLSPGTTDYMVDIGGTGVGATTVDVTLAGSYVSKFETTIYNPRTVRAAFYFIRDNAGISTAWGGTTVAQRTADADRMINEMNLIWEPQAAVTFVSVGVFSEQVVDLGIGINSDYSQTIKSKNIIATANRPGSPASDMDVFFINKIQGHRTDGVTIGEKNVFIPDIGNISSLGSHYPTAIGVTKEGNTMAHEAGHVLKVMAIDHEGLSNNGFVARTGGELMDRYGSNCYIRKIQAQQAHP